MGNYYYSLVAVVGLILHTEILGGYLKEVEEFYSSCITNTCFRFVQAKKCVHSEYTYRAFMNNFLYLRTYSGKHRQCTITFFIEHKKQTWNFCCLLRDFNLIPICHHTHKQVEKNQSYLFVFWFSD